MRRGRRRREKEWTEEGRDRPLCCQNRNSGNESSCRDIARSRREYVASSLLGGNGNPLIILGNFLQHMQHEKSRLLTANLHFILCFQYGGRGSCRTNPPNQRLTTRWGRLRPIDAQKLISSVPPPAIDVRAIRLRRRDCKTLRRQWCNNGASDGISGINR